MRRRLVLTLCSTFLSFVGVIVSAHAATITDRGIEFTLINNGLVSDPILGDAYEFIYRLDIDGYNGAEDADFIGAVSIKVTSEALTAANSYLYSYDAPGTWTYSPNSVAAQGGGGPSCGNGGGGWACASDGSSFLISLGGTYEFVFRLADDLAPFLTGDLAASIHAAYGKFTGPQGANITPAGVTSRGITIDYPPDDPDDPPDVPVPEPTSLILLGSGLLGAAAAARRQKRG